MRPHPSCVAILMAAGAVVAGCATPQPLVRLNPEANDIFWVGGRASVEQSQDGIRVAAAFEHQDGVNLALRMEVQNGTGGRLEIDPQNITFSTCQTRSVGTCKPSQRVIDPEGMLLALDAARSREIADAANTQVALGTLALISAVADVTAVSTGHANQASGLRTAATVGLMDDASAAADTAQASLGMQRHVWADQALRRNTLFPGQGTDGLVYVPIDPQAAFVWVQAIVGGHTFPFRFAQTIIPVDTPAAVGPLSPSSNR